jgi:hypothetical protein
MYYSRRKCATIRAREQRENLKEVAHKGYQPSLRTTVLALVVIEAVLIIVLPCVLSTVTKLDWMRQRRRTI